MGKNKIIKSDFSYHLFVDNVQTEWDCSTPAFFIFPAGNLTSPDTFSSGFTPSIGVGPGTSHAVAHTVIASSSLYAIFCVCSSMHTPGSLPLLFNDSSFILCNRAAGSCPQSPRDEVWCLCALESPPTERALPFYSH